MLHDDELDIDDDLVGQLLSTQAPHLAELKVHRLDSSGSSNALFRLGDELLVRLPRQPGGTATILKEQRWASYVGASLPVACPEVVLVGAPGAGYPEAWSIVRWLPGVTPAVPSHGTDLARDIAGLVVALRDLPVTEEARADPDLSSYRGEPLRDFDDDLRSWVGHCRPLEVELDLDSVLTIWERAVAAHQPVASVRWLHGDLFAENLLVREGRLSAVLDLGGLAVGDPAVDLVVAWEVLDGPGRQTFREALGVDDDAWLIGAGWALLIAVMTLPYYRDTMPDRCRDRLSMARAVVDELG